jgi:hypothetical protein
MQHFDLGAIECVTCAFTAADYLTSRPWQGAGRKKLWSRPMGALLAIKAIPLFKWCQLGEIAAYLGPFSLRSLSYGSTNKQLLGRWPSWDMTNAKAMQS